MPKQLLHRPDVIAVFQEVSGKRVAKTVRSCRLGEPGFQHGLSYRFLQHGFMKMVLLTLSRALRGKFDKHKRVARWTLPLWLYVSVTGVIVYGML